MLAVSIVLGLMFLAAAGVAVWLYLKQQQAQQRRMGSGLATMARGLLAAYTGGISAGFTGGGRAAQ